jgi:hypothetical protein
MDGNALLTPEVFATILATRAMVVALGAEAERARPGAVAEAAEAAVVATTRALKDDAFADLVREQITHFERQSLEAARR